MGHIWLIGMMGSGKTTVGAIVAERSGLPIVDTDTAVMERSGSTIPELFSQSEETFRDHESAVVQQVAAGQSSVVSTGGGVVLRSDNVTLMRATGVTVLLAAKIEDIEARLDGDTSRPLVIERENLADILARRSDVYLAAADHVVGTAGRTPTEVAGEVVAWLNT